MSRSVKESEDWTAAERGAFRRNLMRWYERHGRVLPWRGLRDPYRVWISEVMLQQTTVAAVVPYFERFLARFPSVESLASATEQEVLGLWEGLGYYSRGRNLHRAAGIIVAEHGGRFPQDVAGLQRLPGIGRYTAGAIASFAFGTRAPIVEANTLRLYCRLLGFEDDPRSTAGQKKLWGFAESLLPRQGVSEFNQALMDLGATVCTVASPQCANCPVRLQCRALQAGRQDQIPRAKTPPAITILHEAAIAIADGERWLVRQRRAGERWEGLWDFPRLPLKTEVAERLPQPSLREVKSLLQRVESEMGLVCQRAGALASATYGVTRYRIHVQRVIASYVDGQWNTESQIQWLTLEELETLPMTRSSRLFVRDLITIQKQGRKPAVQQDLFLNGE